MRDLQLIRLIISAQILHSADATEKRAWLRRPFVGVAEYSSDVRRHKN
jgi:hypothetical protein